MGHSLTSAAPQLGTLGARRASMGWGSAASAQDRVAPLQATCPHRRVHPTLWRSGAGNWANGAEEKEIEVREDRLSP